MDPRGQRQNAARGADLRYDLELTLEEAFAGTGIEHHGRGAGALRRLRGPRRARAKPRADLRDLQRRRQGPRAAGILRRRARLPDVPGQRRDVADPCPACDGEGRALKRRSLSVKIPAGVDEGTRIRVSGEGEAGIRDAANGDLYIFVHMKRHPLFQRDGTTLVAECPVSFTTAALGGSISLPGVDGDKIEVKIPPGIRSGEHCAIAAPA